MKAKKKKVCPASFQNITQIVKTSSVFHDSKRRRMELSCIKKTVSIINRNKNIGFVQYQKPIKAPFMHLECLVKKDDEFKNNPENTSAAKVVEHILSIFWIFTIPSIKSIENRYMYTRARTVSKRFANP